MDSAVAMARMAAEERSLRLLGLDWSEPTPSLVGVPEGSAGDEIRLALVPGEPFALALEGPRCCIGCTPARLIGPRGSGLCGACRVGSTALTTPSRTDQRGLEALERLRAVPHVLYLALFGRGFVKVGVSARPERRLREQGAMAALLVAEGDGVDVRQMERLAVRAGLPDVVRTQRKARLLSERPSEEEARRALEAASARLGEAAVVPGGNAPFLYLADTYPGRLPAPEEPVTTPPRFWPGDRLVGRIRGVVGGLLLLDDADLGLLAVDSSRLEGYRGRPVPPEGTSSVRELAALRPVQPPSGRGRRSRTI